MAHSIADADFQKEVLESPVPVLVDFWAPWCGPCKVMSPILEELGAEYGETKLKVVKLNVDENQAVPGQYNIMSLPTFFIFKGGQPVSSFIGSRSKEDLKREVEKIIAA